jgi:hypothetical protein
VKRLVRGRLPALRLRALRRGVFGGDNRWLAVWGLLASARLLKRLATPKPVVERFVLRPGETLTISDLGSEDLAAPS